MRGHRHPAHEVAGWSALFLPTPLPSNETQLLHVRTTALDDKTQHDDKKRAGDDPDDHCIVHSESPFSQLLRKFLNESAMSNIAGPKVTRNRHGKINNTNGKISLMVVLAAISSTA